jgi:hypothetical protein
MRQRECELSRAGARAPTAQERVIIGHENLHGRVPSAGRCAVILKGSIPQDQPLRIMPGVLPARAKTFS